MIMMNDCKPQSNNSSSGCTTCACDTKSNIIQLVYYSHPEKVALYLTSCFREILGFYNRCFVIWLTSTSHQIGN